MKSNRVTNAVFVLIFLVAVIVFGYVYNTTTNRAVSENIEEDKLVLSDICKEIANKLSKTENEKEWEAVLSQYDGIQAEIRDENNNVIFNTTDKFNNIYGVKIRNIFSFNGRSYLLSITAFLFRNMQNGVKSYYIIEATILGLIVALIVIFIYIIMVRPYRKFYESIEEYDQTGEIKRIKLRGYTGRVYDRFFRMAVSQKHAQENQQRIIASISHDIKTPLTSIMGYSERLKNLEISDTRRDRYIDVIYNKSRDISSIIDGFDEYVDYRLKSQLSVEEYTLEEIKNALIRDFSIELENHGIDFEINCKNKRTVVSLDKNKMKRVFSNIITNSIKHIKSNYKLIKVDLYSEDETAYFVISDSGEGVPEDKLESIFDPLYTSDEGRKVAGLGLSICKEIVEKHGGLIYAKPSPLGGLTIVIEMKQSF